MSPFPERKVLIGSLTVSCITFAISISVVAVILRDVTSLFGELDDEMSRLKVQFYYLFTDSKLFRFQYDTDLVWSDMQYFSREVGNMDRFRRDLMQKKADYGGYRKDLLSGLSISDKFQRLK